MPNSKMVVEPVQRRLAAILAADVLGYSRLVRENEEGTLSAVKSDIAETFDPSIEAHNGRIFKTTGDGLLVEFASVVDAVRCAVKVQRAMEDRNAERAEDRKIEFRIGINLGDVVAEGEDLHGDGVNVAARLEGLAEPGGIWISGSAFEQVRDKLDVGFEDQGDQQVKNIARPIRAYRVAPDQNGISAGRTAYKEASGAKRWQVPAMAAIAVVIVAVAGLAVWRPWVPTIEPASVERMAFALPDKPSIAVLPFNNMSNDPEQEFFVDGITEDLITDLAKVSGLFVVARNSTFAYKGKAVDVRTVAETLGVKYILEGSVRRAGDQLRVNAQLIDATTGGHVWADRFDGQVANIFAVQDEFVLKIVEALSVQLSESEKILIDRDKTDNIEAREAFQRGWELLSRFNPHDNAKAESQLRKAIELDSEFGRAHAALALVYYRANRFSWEVPLGLTWEHLLKLKSETLEIAKQHPTSLVHVVVALEHAHDGTSDLARLEAAQAIAMQPNDPEAHIAMALAMIISGRPVEGLNFVQAAMRLNPRYPSNYVVAQGIALFAIGNLEEAAITLEEGIARDPGAIELLPLLASILAQLDRRQDARDTVLKWKPGLSKLEFRSVAYDYQAPIKWALEHDRFRERLFDGLRVAVLPLDTTVSSLLGELKAGSQLDVIQTLGWFGPSAAVAVPDLIKALGDEVPYIRVEAAITLGKIGPRAKAAIPALAAISDDIVVVSYAKKALKEIIGN
jgi:TolB-like protein/class 3 adenylate cyclase/Flp pilus assembly protein TadD